MLILLTWTFCIAGFLSLLTYLFVKLCENEKDKTNSNLRCLRCQSIRFHTSLKLPNHLFFLLKTCNTCKSQLRSSENQAGKKEWVSGWGSREGKWVLTLLPHRRVVLDVQVIMQTGAARGYRVSYSGLAQEDAIQVWMGIYSCNLPPKLQTHLLNRFLLSASIYWVPTMCQRILGEENRHMWCWEFSRSNIDEQSHRWKCSAGKQNKTKRASGGALHRSTCGHGGPTGKSSLKKWFKMKTKGWERIPMADVQRTRKDHI